MRKRYLALLCLILWGIPYWFKAEIIPLELNSREPAPKIFARLAGGLILVEATLNGQAGTYILDTGASHLFINKKNLLDSNNYAAGLGAGTSINEATISTFQLGTQIYTDQIVYQMDMSHLERIKGCPIAGIIGMDMLRDFTLHINYEKGIVVLQPADMTIIEQAKPTKIITLTWQEHFPIVVVTVDQQPYNFAIDTGAETNLFFDNYEKRVEKMVKHSAVRKVWGIGNTAVQMKKIELTQLHCLDQVYYNQEFMFANLTGLNQSYAVSLDGILGFPFLKNQSFTLDFQAEEMRIW